MALLSWIFSSLFFYQLLFRLLPSTCFYFILNRREGGRERETFPLDKRKLNNSTIFVDPRKNEGERDREVERQSEKGGRERKERDREEKERESETERKREKER